MTPSGNKTEIRLHAGVMLSIFKDGVFQCDVAVTNPGDYIVDEVVKFGGYTSHIKRYNTLRTYGKYLYNSWYWTTQNI